MTDPDVTEAGDGWRFLSPCAGGCGFPVVTIPEYIGQGRCIDCGRAHFGAQVPARPIPGANNHLPMGQTGRSNPGRLDHNRLNAPLRGKGRGR